jgi:hypothetical protein
MRERIRGDILVPASLCRSVPLVSGVGLGKNTLACSAWKEELEIAV